MTGVSKNTIVKLLVELGAACTKYQDAALRNLSSKRIQCDEIWSFVGGKDKNISQEKKEKGLGSVWTWTALDADSKLIVTWLVGSRDAGQRTSSCRMSLDGCGIAYSSPPTAISPI
jgi:hypothetical protein